MLILSLKSPHLTPSLQHVSFMHLLHSEFGEAKPPSAFFQFIWNENISYTSKISKNSPLVTKNHIPWEISKENKDIVVWLTPWTCFPLSCLSLSTFSLSVSKPKANF